VQCHFAKNAVPGKLKNGLIVLIPKQERKSIGLFVLSIRVGTVFTTKKLPPVVIHSSLIAYVKDAENLLT